MKQQTLTPKMQRQRKMLIALPIIILPFLTLFFWTLGGGKGNPALAQTTGQKGLNTRLPDAKLKDNRSLNKMSYYDQAALDSNKLRQQMKSDPYYRSQAGGDTAGLHFPLTVKGNTVSGGHFYQPSQPDGASAGNVDKVYQKLAQLQSTINKPPAEPKPVVTPPVTGTESPLKNVVAPEDPQLSQMNGLLEKILDIQHPERIKAATNPAENTTAVKKFRAIPAVIEGTQKIVQGTVIRMKLLDTVTIGGTQFSKGQLIYGSGTLASQRYTLNIKSIHVGYNFYPVDLTVFDQTDGLEGISVPEAITGDALRDGANSGVQNMDIMSFDPSMTAQLTTAGINTAKGLLGKKIKWVKAKLKDGHPLLLRDNQEGKSNR
jgi:hypothetical protein